MKHQLKNTVKYRVEHEIVQLLIGMSEYIRKNT